MPPKKPKIPSHLLKRIKSMKPQEETRTPTTFSDFFELGTEEEESGDRWVISDISKMLRYYNKAILNYEKSIELNPKADNFDAWFNRSRLSFQVYSTLKDVKLVDIGDVDKCEKVIGISLEDVRLEHERIIKMFNDDESIINWDFYYNYGLVLIEVLENDENFGDFEKLESVAGVGARLFNKIVDILTVELEGFLSRLNGEDIEDTGRQETKIGDGEGNEATEYSVVEQVTPKTFFDALSTTLRFIQVSLEATENEFQLEHLKSVFEGLLKRCFTERDLLVSKFGPEADNAHGLNLSKQEIFEFELVRHSLAGLCMRDFAELINHWDSFRYELANDRFNGSSRYLIESDNFETFRERYVDDNNYDLQWEVLSRINKCLKTAQDSIKIDLQTQIDYKTSLISSRVSKSVEILINRSDNELRRLGLGEYAKSLENKQLLTQNIISLLKNGLTLSETNCGLREVILDRFKRERLRRECIVRLVVFTKSSYSEQDLIRNLGKDYYIDEFNELKEVDCYGVLCKSRLEPSQ